MYVEPISSGKMLPLMYLCQICEISFGAQDSAQSCPECFSTDRSSLVILHMEEDQARAEWLELVDVCAGD
jgi:hypothetical protein